MADDHASDHDDSSDDVSVHETFVPSELCSRGRTIWIAVTPALIAAGRLKQGDVQAMTRYCDLAATYWELVDEIRRDGNVLKVPTVAKEIDENGKEQTGYMFRAHPGLAQKKMIAGELRMIEDSFGMSPLSRANLVNKQLSRRPGQGELEFAPPAQPDTEDSPDSFRRRH